MTRTCAREVGRWIGNAALMVLSGAIVFQLAKAVVVVAQLAH